MKPYVFFCLFGKKRVLLHYKNTNKTRKKCHPIFKPYSTGSSCSSTP